jgi:hypothetical protein
MDVRPRSLLLLPLLLACGADRDPPSSGAPDGGDLASDAAPHDGLGTPISNPYGAPYPTENLGWRPRQAGPGQVIPNVAVRGRVPSGAFADVYLSTFYDPDDRAHVLVAIVAGWHQSGLTAETARDLLDARLDDVAVVPIVGDSPSVPATEAFVETFAAETGMPFVLLDPRQEALSRLYDSTASPAVVTLDARTMEIVRVDVGQIPPELVRETLEEVRARPPSY